METSTWMWRFAAQTGHHSWPAGRLAEMEPLCREELALQRKLRAYDCLRGGQRAEQPGLFCSFNNTSWPMRDHLLESVAMHRRITGNTERGLALINLAKVFQLEGNWPKPKRPIASCGGARKNAEGAARKP